jgi:hypothetical protein
MDQDEVVKRISSEILYYELAPSEGIERIQMYINQAYAAGYDHRLQTESSMRKTFQRERVFP